MYLENAISGKRFIGWSRKKYVLHLFDSIVARGGAFLIFNDNVLEWLRLVTEATNLQCN